MAGGGSATGRRSSLLALGALLALIASVLFWASPSDAQRNESPPVALASVRVTMPAAPTATPPTPAVATLTSNSFDPDTGGTEGTNGILSQKWEVVTEAYSWLSLRTPTEATATFDVPSPALAARYGQTIEFRLTVTDNDTPAATDSTTVTFNINQGPMADIAVTAMLADPASPDVDNYDDNGNGTKDENAEKYPLDGVIDGPGENGNADNEWDIAEGSLLILDGSGSSDPNGALPAGNHVWTRVYPAAATTGVYETDPLASLPSDTGTGASRTGAGNGKKMISTDENLEEDDDTRSNEVMTPLVSAAARAGLPAPSFFVYYRLTVTDTNTLNPATSSAVVKIVVHDQPKDPVIDSIVPTANTDTAAGGAAGSAISCQTGASGTACETGAPGSNRYIIAPRSAITLTITDSQVDGDNRPYSDADGDNPTVTWEGARSTNPAVTVDLTSDPPVLRNTTAAFTAPADAEEGDEFTITATATDVTGRTTSKSVTLVVATNTAPEAVAPGTAVFDATATTVSLYSQITVNDGPDGGDIDPLTKRGTGVVKLRGISHDADGDSLIHAWTELDMARTGDPLVDTLPSIGATGAINMPRPIRPPAKSVVTIDGAFSQDASFKVPEVNAQHPTINIAYDLNGDGDTDDTGEDAVPALHVPIAFTVLDQWQVKTTKIVIVRIVNNDDPPRANAGPDQQVTPGSFIRLNGAGSSDSDPGDRLSHAWTFTKVETDPLTQNRPAITATERGLGYVEGTWFPYDGIVQVNAPDGPDAGTDPDIANVAVFSNYTFTAEPDEKGVYAQGAVTSANAGGPAGPGADGEAGTADDIIQVEPGVLKAADTNDAATPQDETRGDAPRGSYHPTAGGKLKNEGTAFPYFDAPRLGGFSSIKLTFQLVVTDGRPGGSPALPAHLATRNPSRPDTVTITITDGFYSGIVTGPDFCLARSLGGPTTHPFDSDFDGVADTCSLNTTRRATVARQNALETLAALNPDTFKDHLHGKAAVIDDNDTPGDTSDDTVTSPAIASQCAQAPRNLGDSAGDLANDSCGRVGTFNRVVSSPPRPVDPAKADEFFSGVITGPNFCANNSLGGPTTYAFDSDDDGVADICSLPFTRREAVARQNALNAAFATHPQYDEALAAACATLGSTSFGDSVSDLAKDECSRPPAPTTGTALPTS